MKASLRYRNDKSVIVHSARKNQETVFLFFDGDQDGPICVSVFHLAGLPCGRISILKTSFRLLQETLDYEASDRPRDTLSNQIHTNNYQILR